MTAGQIVTLLALAILAGGHLGRTLESRHPPEVKPVEITRGQSYLERGPTVRTEGVLLHWAGAAQQLVIGQDVQDTALICLSPHEWMRCVAVGTLRREAW